MTEELDSSIAAARLRAAENILILCHKNPDGDTLGSAGALYWALKALDKDVAVLCSDAIPQMYSYLQMESFTGQWKPGFIVAVDVASLQLFGDNNDVQSYAPRADLCIDHHGSNTGYAYGTLLDANAAATCELLADFIPDALGVPLTEQIADCLYTGISTDTGCFRFSATTTKTHLAASRVMEAGAHVSDLNEILFESRSRARMDVERMALESLEYHFDGRCALVCLSKEQIEQSGVAPAELEDLTSLPRSIEGVMIGLTLRQQPSGSYKISVRTTKQVNACTIAKHLGGGGHNRAAGCELEGNLENVRSVLLDEVERAFQALEEACKES